MGKSPDQAIYEARCKARGVEPAPFGKLNLEKINEERRKVREIEKCTQAEANRSTVVSRGKRDDG